MMQAAFLIPGNIDRPTGGYAYDRRVLALLAAFGVEARHVALPGSFPAPSAADLAQTQQQLAELPADTVLLFDGLAYGALPADLIQHIRQPIVALCHHPLALEAGLTVARAADLKSSETTALARARYVVVTSPMTRALLASDFGVPLNKITVAEPGTDPAERAIGSLDGLPPQMLAVGSIIPRKGYDVLLRALAPLTSRDWRLTIVGATDLSPATVEQVRGLIIIMGLGHRVRLTGPVRPSALAAHYHGADLFVMPSLFEGYGMVLAEAMARGLPIVCTTGGAAAETAPDAAAIKVPPGDADALGAAIGRVLGDRALRQTMGDAAWVAGAKLPRWHDTARIVADVLRKVAA